MKITTKSLQDRHLSLTIEVDEDRARRARRRAARRISNQVDIPGFRKGKAPYDVIAQRLGEEPLEQEIAESLAEEVYQEALEQEEIAPYAPATLEEMGLDPLTFTFEVSLAPKVELGDYRNYRLEPPDDAISEQELEQALEEIREENAILVPLEHPAAEGDMVVIDLVGRTDEDQTFLRQDEAHILLDDEGDEPVPGLAGSIIGMEEGEERTFTLTLPDDFSPEALQGKPAELTVELHGVYERILPELDDDLARTAGNFETFGELEMHVERQLRESAQAEAESEYEEQVLEDIIDQAEVAYPPDMLEEALDDAVEDHEEAVRRQEHLMLEDYLRIQGKTMEGLRDELRPDVADSLERSLIMGEIVRREGLEVSEEEIDAQIEQSSEEWGERADEVRAALDTSEGRQDVRGRMLARKAIERLVAIARGESPELTSTAEIEGPEELEAED